MKILYIILLLALVASACNQPQAEATNATLEEEDPNTTIGVDGVDEVNEYGEAEENADVSVALNQIPVTELPFSIADWLFKEVDDVERYFKMLHQIKEERFQSPILTNLNQVKIEHNKDFLTPELKYEYDLFYKRLAPPNDSIEVLIYYNESEDEINSYYSLYVTLSLVTYNTKRNKMVDQLNFFEGGTGREDRGAFNGIRIDKSYNIELINHYMFEGDESFIKNYYQITPSGNIMRVEKGTPITNLPYEVGEWLFENLTDEARYLKKLNKIDEDRSNFPFLSYVYNLKIDYEANPHRPPMLLLYDRFYKRLPQPNDSTEVFLFFNTNNLPENQPYVLLTLISFNMNNEKVIDELTLMEGGIGKDSVMIYSGAKIHTDYKMDLVSHIVSANNTSIVLRTYQLNKSGKFEKL